MLILAPGSVFCVLVAPHFRGKLPGGVAVLPATIVFLVWVGALGLANQADDRLSVAESWQNLLQREKSLSTRCTYRHSLFGLVAMQLLISCFQAYAVVQMVLDKNKDCLYRHTSPHPLTKRGYPVHTDGVPPHVREL